LNAQLTEIGIIAGLVSIMAGILVARLVFEAAPIRRPLLSWAASPDDLRQLGYYTAFIGLPAQIFWTIHISHFTAEQHGGIDQQSTGAPVFSFLAPLALVSICCFATEELLRTNRRSFLSYRSMTVLAIYLAAILPLATKTEPLRPVVALFVVALVYRWRPRLAPVLGGLALLIVVMEFFYPAVTLARLTAYAEQRPTAVVFGEVALKSITDPGEFDYVRDYSDSYELGIDQTYFGRPMGFWDRFTPQQTDRLINGSQYVESAGISIFRDALYELLPQSLGFKKSLNAQTRLEIALDRKTQGRGQVSWANSGYVGDGFVCGGLFMDIVFCFLCGLSLSLMSRITFVHYRADVLWVPLFCTLMFLTADSGFVSTAFPNFWTCAIYIGALYLLLRYMASRNQARAAQAGGVR